MCYNVNLRTNGCLTFLPPQIVGQQLASEGLTTLGQLITTSTWELLKHEGWEPKKFERCFYKGGQRKTLLLQKL
jgi:hypothetical protein